MLGYYLTLTQCRNLFYCVREEVDALSRHLLDTRPYFFHRELPKETWRVRVAKCENNVLPRAECSVDKEKSE